MKAKKNEKWIVKKALERWQLFAFLLPALAWLAVFAYYPMYGLIIAFKDYKGRMGILGSPWAEPVFKHFGTFFNTSIAMNAIGNTVAISLLTLVIGFPIPIIFALLLNQIRNQKVRKTIQTITYAPYFLSTVVIVSLISMLFSANGLVNTTITGLGGKEIFFTSLAEWFRPLFIGSSVWQTMGFSAIVFIAALVGINPDYYEAAIVDGATRFQRILHIDIPLILPTIVLMLILNVGNIMNVGYEKAYLMQNNMNTTVSELISTYVYKVGLQQAQYSFAAAVGLFNSIINFILLVCVNFVAKKFSSISVF